MPDEEERKKKEERRVPKEERFEKQRPVPSYVELPKPSGDRPKPKPKADKEED